jgi:UDP-N-acetylglucosamine acyltransferase
MNIHPTAIVEAGAELADDVEIGAYAFIGPQVKLGRGTIIHHHGVVEGRTTLGEGNEIFPFACIGTKTHDLKYQGGTPGLVIGNHNVFREYATVHGATKADEDTVLGDHNTILAYSHIAHDCRVGNHLVMSSHSAVAGHVVVGDHVNIAWNAGVHQFCRVGSFAMVAACSKVVQDVLPFFIVDGNPAEHRAINKIGLERNGHSPEAIEAAKKAFKVLFRSGLNRTQALERLRSEAPQPVLDALISAITSSTRGIS